MSYDVNDEANNSEENEKDSTQYVMAVHLDNKSFIHLFMAQDTLLPNEDSTSQYFIFDQCAERDVQCMMPDICSAKVSTAENGKFQALQHEMSKIELDTTCVNKIRICLRSRLIFSSIGIFQLLTPVSTTYFHVIDTSTSFFLRLKDMNTLGIYLNNITNQLICQNSKSILIFCKSEHC